MIILASKSHIRHQLLQNAGVPHQVMPSPLDEETEKSLHKGITPKQLAQNLASAKALALSTHHPASYILGADQTLEFQATSLHKCHSLHEAKQLLTHLRGQPHALHAAISIAKGEEIMWQHVSTVHLTMRQFSDQFLDEYIRTNGEDILHAVGCYTYETTGIQLFDRIDGDYHAILGLPLLPLLAFLRQIGELKT